jgi:hypothetical protein
MKKIIAAIFIVVCVHSFVIAGEPKLKKIFTGKNLNGWVAKPDVAGCWTVNKGILYVKNSENKTGAILWTEKSYTDFVFQADFLMGDGTVDSGIFLRSESDQIQIGISGSLKRDLTGSPYLPKLKYPVEANVKGILKEKEWNTMKIKVTGKTYTVWLNGVEVMTYTSTFIPEKGPIGIQLHPGNVMSIQYKHIKLAEL